MLRFTFLLLFLHILVACHSEPPEKHSVPVQAAIARKETGFEGYPYSAVVNPYTQVDVAFRTEGYIDEIPTRRALGEVRILQGGDQVIQGEPLAIVNDEQYRDKVIEAAANVSKAEAARRKADLDYKRASALFATASITAPDYDAAREEYEVSQASVVGAKARLDTAREDLNDTVLRSPLTGIILQRNIEVGTLVHRDTVGFVVADTSRVKVVFNVPDVVLGYTKLGSVVAMRTESLPRKVFTGQVTEVSPEAEERTRVFTITVTVPNPDALLKTGLVMSLVLDRGQVTPNRVVIPLSCLVTQSSVAEGFAVFVLEIEQEVLRAKLRRVIPGPVIGNSIVILHGLSVGDRVVSNGSAQLQDGQAVRVVP
ncbi:efflux RND transporter periplasmic adaptor subunit [Microbulbifer variabilis]|uniref:efflux RND transporter periplasmic adaptor subunit n=1 Tax=Microbulbifer variabilis TaxID=266805 RepID=UPI001CFE285A|nr:efflux RND transporter periplasmic adaptor subunit [Microbulbifer variabilis]